jgi:cation-transporting ATPase 13A3/4/5
MWIAVWALMASEAAILLIWHLYKTAREAAFHRAQKSKTGSDLNLDDKKEDEKLQDTPSSIKESEKLTLRGFKNDILGWIGFGSVVITTLLCFVFLGIIVGDYCKYFCLDLKNRVCFIYKCAIFN